MAVSKEELFARYKQLKAEGVSISIMELKKQMEAEASQAEAPAQSISEPPYNSSYTGQPETPKQTGFSALSSSIAPAPAQNSEPRNAAEPAPAGWTTSYYSEPEPPAVIESAGLSQISDPVSYSGNISQSTVNNQDYMNNFSTTFSFRPEHSAPSQPVEMPQEQPQNPETAAVPYTGNVISQEADCQKPQNIIKKYCLIGYPLGHSLSSYIHNAGFKSLGLNSIYEVLETPPDSLVDRIKFLKFHNYAGFNVTIPLKLPVTLFLDEVDASADIVGAVNTVVINPDKTMKGYNTDVIGFRNAIPDDFTNAGKTAGVLGTGGAARAAITALAQSQAKQIKIFTRNIPNAVELLNFLRNKFPHVEFNAFQIERIRDLSDIQILVNTTPIGMQGRAADLTPVEENELRTLPSGALVYDVIYNPKKTVLIKLAQKNGYRTINGVDMFIHQALAAEQIWTGCTPDFKDMKIAALENL